MSQTRTVGIFIFPDVEVLDFCGPFEVFSVAGHQIADGTFRAIKVAGQVREIGVEQTQ